MFKNVFSLLKPKKRCSYQISCFSQILIRDAISHDLKSNQIRIQGWIKSVRTHKDNIFLDINDGSSFKCLQVVVPTELYSNNINFECCVEIDGNLQKSLYPNQLMELRASKIKVLGDCDVNNFPIKMHQKHSLDYLRSLPHLRFKTKTFSSLLRIRNVATFTAHKYFQSENFCHVNSPILTTNDCEGAGEVFRVEPVYKMGHESKPKSIHGQSCKPEKQNAELFFGAPTFLTVSGQLHLEVITGSFSKVYTIGPTFRAEDSHTRHHLSEFSMIEAEVAFTNSLNDITKYIEEAIKSMTSAIMDQCSSDISFFFKKAVCNKLEERVLKILYNKFHRITYTEAVSFLLNSQKKFSNKVFWGMDLHKEQERFLVEQFNDVPLFVVDYPAYAKPFYSRSNDDNLTVASVDLLFSDVGEVCGGSLREERYNVLHSKLMELPSHKSLDWYLELRKYGSCPHGGFGLGFERYIQMLLGLKNIRDALPFPRYTNNCKL